MSRISAEDVERLLERIRRDDPTLTEVNLRYSGIGDAGVVRIAEAFTGNTHVTHLWLFNNNIGPEGARALAGMLRNNTALITLYLEGNNIGDEGTNSLADALHENSVLTYLGLGGNDIGDEGARALAGVLHENSALTKLWLKYNDIDANLASKLRQLAEINADAPDHPEARRLKVEARIDWMIDSDDGGQEEEAASLALAELGSFPEASRRRGLFRHLLGSAEHGAAVAAAVDAARAGVLYRYAAECGSAPAVLTNLLRAHPSLCECRDVKEKLYPFMLLATMEEAGVGDVMDALLANLSLVKGGIAGPAECMDKGISV